MALYDDYRIEASKYWKLKAYHFVSIDTWLQGTCGSCCAEHEWKAPPAKEGGRFSIFATDKLEEGEAGDGDS